MDYQLQLFRRNRENTLALLEGISLEEGNAIPVGFRNNIIWNAGHVVAAQQGLIYYFSGQPQQVPKGFGRIFGQGTLAREYTAEEFIQVKSLLLDTARQTEVDYRNGLFTSYKTYTSEYFGITMTTVEEAMQFSNYHEGLHLGYMLALRRAVRRG